MSHVTNLTEKCANPDGGFASEPSWTVTLKKHLVALIWVILFSGATYLLLTRFVVMTVVVQGRSMVPTLREGDVHLLNRLACLYREPQREDVVVIRDPGHTDCAVKRIVAQPGDLILFKAGEVYVNGERLNESYLSRGMKTYSDDAKNMMVMVGKGRYFVMGDNRAWSEDSRAYGSVQRRQIVGLLAHWKHAPAKLKTRPDYESLRLRA